MLKDLALVTIIVLCFAFEVIAIGYGWINNVCWLPWTVLALDLLLLFWILQKGKTVFFRLIVVRAIKSATGSLVGVAFIIYLLVHIGFVQDRLQEIWAGSETWRHLAIVLAVFPVPFLVNALITSPILKRIKPEDRRILLTGLSLFDNQRKDDSPIVPTNPDGGKNRDAEVISEIQKHADWHHWGAVPWKPIFQAIALFPQLKRVVVLVTKETQFLRTAIRSLDPKLDIDHLIHQYFPSVEVKFEELNDSQMIASNVEDLKAIIKHRLGKIEDADLVFAITGGTAAVSAALAMMAAKGNRGVVYVRQDNYSLVEDTVTVYQLEDLWEDLLIISN